MKQLKLLAYATGLLTLAGCGASKNTMTTVQGVSPTMPAVSLWTGQYGGADKSYDTKLLALREEVAPRFSVFTYVDKETGITMEYNLYIPKNYDPSKKYPIVLYMADASTVGKGAVAPLKQGYGGIIWATDESQAEHPSFVLVPSYRGPERATNDDWEVSAEVPTTYHLLQDVLSRYSIDRNRIYATGQSMGGMISFHFASKYPDLFAAFLFVGTQWDINVLTPLAKQKFIYIISAGEAPGTELMGKLGKMLRRHGISYGDLEFPANLPDAIKEKYVYDLLSKGYSANLIRFTKGTVIPIGNTKSANFSEHMYGFDYAYQLKELRQWLFAQTK